jgi:hypothetical protein
MRAAIARVFSKRLADGYTFADPLFGSAAIFPSCCNYGLVGASADLLSEAWRRIATASVGPATFFQGALVKTRSPCRASSSGMTGSSLPFAGALL